MTGNKRSRAAGIACLSMTIALFSTFEVTSKFLSPHMSPVQITFSRFLIGGLILLPFAVLRMKRRAIGLTPRDLGNCALLGFVNIVVSMGLIQLGLVYANASICAVLFSVNPLFVVIFAKILLGERITPQKVAGLACGVIGVVVLFFDSVSSKTSTWQGLVLILGSAVFFALYTVMGKKIINGRLDSLIVTAVSFLAGSLFLVPVMLLLGVPFVPDYRPVAAELLYMSIAVTGIAYVLYFEGLSRLEAGAGSMLYFAKPALASVLAIAILGERPGVNLLAGIAVIAAGIFLSQLNRGNYERQGRAQEN